MISIQGIFSLLLEAVIIGIIFARVSHPKQRSRSIFISDTAIIARRDGILKFMFRVADVRKTQVVDPKIKAYLYTWGDGRITAEGERVPGEVWVFEREEGGRRAGVQVDLGRPLPRCREGPAADPSAADPIPPRAPLQCGWRRWTLGTSTAC